MSQLATFDDTKGQIPLSNVDPLDCMHMDLTAETWVQQLKSAKQKESQTKE